MSRLGINRCMCFDRTFADLADVAADTGAASVAELQEHALFGRKCRLCHPYVRRMLRTGQTVFDEVVSEADEPEPDARPLADDAPRPEAAARG